MELTGCTITLKTLLHSGDIVNQINIAVPYEKEMTVDEILNKADLAKRAIVEFPLNAADEIVIKPLFKI